jgi:hypothetical protein
MHRGIKTWGGMEINCPAFLISMVNGVSGQLGAQATLNLGKNWAEGWAGLTSGLDVAPGLAENWATVWIYLIE